MRKRLLSGVLIVFFISIFMISASGATKIAIVDVNEVVQNYQEFKDGVEKLKTKYIERQNELDSKLKDLAEKEQDLKKRASVMDEGTFNQEKESLETEFKSLQELYAQYQQELNVQEKELFEKLEQKVLFVVEDIAKDEGYSIVLNKQATLYYDKDMDITSQVQDQLYR